MLIEDGMQAVNKAMGTCLNPSAPSTCPPPQPAPAPAPAPAAHEDRDQSSSQRIIGVTIGVTVAAIVVVLSIGLGVLACVLRRDKRRAPATSASVKHGNGEVLMRSVGAPAPAVAWSALPPASPQAMSPPDGFAWSAPAAPREAATPAALIVGAGMPGPPVQEGNGKDPTEDDFAMLSPAALPPMALLKPEQSGTGSSAAKGSGVIRHQSLLVASSGIPQRASLSNVGSSLVAPLAVLNRSHCAFMSMHWPVLLLAVLAGALSDVWRLWLHGVFVRLAHFATRL
jgi:hypothetical protein